jgi:PAS domain S-box-containing protein
MKLGTRLLLAMVVLVVVTGAAVGLSGLYFLQRAIVPGELDRLAIHAKSLAATLDNYSAGAGTEALGLAGAPSVAGIFRAEAAGGIDPEDGTSLVVWRQRLAALFASVMRAHRKYVQLRLIGRANGGEEIVRVDREAAGGAVRVLANSELQRKGGRGYVVDALKLAPGSVYVSVLDLNVEHGKIQVPYMPVLRTAAPVAGPNGETIGVVVVNIDMRPIFRSLTALELAGGEVFVVNQRGDYLVNPDPGLPFGYELGRPHRWQQDFPALARDRFAAGARMTESADGHHVAAAFAPILLDGKRPVTVIETIPRAVILAPVAAVANAALIAAIIGGLLAILLAMAIARSLTRPLQQITGAIEAFSKGEDRPLPVAAAGEVGMLARAFARLVQGEKFYGAILDSSDDAILTTTLEGVITSWNPAAERLYGHGAAEAVGQHVNLIVPAERRDNHDRLMARVRNGERVAGIETLRQRKDGSLVEVSISVSPVKSPSGKLSGVSTICRDITERRALEARLAQSQKLEAIGQLTGGIAHDFNNLLHVIESNAEILTATVTDPEDRKSVAMIATAADRGAELTRSLLAFGRRQVLNIGPVEINELVAHVEGLARRTLGEDIELVAMPAPNLPLAIADQAQLESALLNLLINARDAMPQGGRLMVETTTVSIDERPDTIGLDDMAEGDYVVIAVNDTGTGMPPEIVAQVFEPFFTTKEPGKGTGLGLSMVYGLMKQLGGHVRIYSELGHGTTVKLFLPQAPSEAAAAAPQAAVEIKRGSGERILVVDDNEMVLAAVERQFQSLGYRVVTATTAQAALELLEGGPSIDLLFTDVILAGGMNGPELADAATARFPALKVLFTSGYTERAALHTHRVKPGAELLTKPYKMPDLARRVRQVLDR